PQCPNVPRSLSLFSAAGPSGPRLYSCDASLYPAAEAPVSSSICCDRHVNNGRNVLHNTALEVEEQGEQKNRTDF
ncbi:hypothetical protein GOODEAATRI_002375, partial [Goodea atripinnis]